MRVFRTARLARTGHDLLIEKFRAMPLEEKLEPARPVMQAPFSTDVHVPEIGKDDVLIRVLFPIDLNQIDGIVYVKSILEVPLSVEILVNDKTELTFDLVAGENLFSYKHPLKKGCRVLVRLVSGRASDIWMSMYGTG
jgi:hypothetical protein